VLEAYFDRKQGHGYSLCRVHMGSCDFALGNYAHVETPGDLELASFSIARDKEALLPFIQAAQRAAGEPLRLLAPELGKPFASQVFGGKYAYNMWWTEEPRQIRGINLLPFTPASTYLGADPAFVCKTIDALPGEVKTYQAKAPPTARQPTSGRTSWPPTSRSWIPRRASLSGSAAAAWNSARPAPARSTGCSA